MRLKILGSRDTIIGKNNNRRDFGELLYGNQVEYSMKNIINRYMFIFYEE